MTTERNSEKIVLRNLAKGESLYNRGFSIVKWAAENNKHEMMEVGMRMMDRGLEFEKAC